MNKTIAAAILKRQKELYATELDEKEAYNLAIQMLKEDEQPIQEEKTEIENKKGEKKKKKNDK